MLELAIAEAYRPHPRVPSNASSRPLSFATNPNAKAPTSSLRQRRKSALTASSSTYSRPLSFPSFLTRRRRPDSVLSGKTEVPTDTVLTDSVLSSTPEDAGSDACREFTPIRQYPVLPANVPLPPPEELEVFDNVLQTAIDDLQISPAPAACDLASMTLSHLGHVADVAVCVATSRPEFWSMIVHAAKLLVSVLPPGEVLVRDVLVRVLARIATRWNESQCRGCARQSTAELARVAGGAIEEMMLENQLDGGRLGAESIGQQCVVLRAQSCMSQSDSVCLTATEELDGISSVERTAALRVLDSTSTYTSLSARGTSELERYILGEDSD